MKVLHVMPDDKFANSVILFYDQYFDTKEHIMCILLDSGEPRFYRRNSGLSIQVYEHPNIAESVVKAMSWVKWAKQYDYIVMHSFCLRKFSLFIPGKKLVWIEWGYDLYEYEISRDKSIFPGFRNRFTHMLRSRIGAFVGIFPPDIQYYQNHFPKSKARIYYAPYICSKPTGNFRDYRFCDRFRQAEVSGKPVQIQIGHNGQEQLHHIDTLYMLEHLKDENILILLSMSYGAEDKYVRQVEETAKALFGKKAVVLKEFMLKDEYMKLIAGTDVAIFNTTRQTGLANIHRLLYQGTKMYFRKDGAMYGFFRENGFDVKDISELPRTSYKELCTPAENDEAAAKKYFLQRVDFEANVQSWRDIFDNLRICMK